MTKKKKKKVKRAAKQKRVVTCSVCGETGHNARSCEKEAPGTGRQVFDHEVCVHGTYWAPFGNKGWSAVRVTKVGYKHAQVDRVKPKTQELIAKGKVRKDELLKRDAKLGGRDRPQEGPADVFSTYREQREQLEQEEQDAKIEREQQAPPRVVPVMLETTPVVEDDELTVEATALPPERLRALLDLIDDDATTDDW